MISLLLTLALLQFPTASRTPGATNPAVTQANIHVTICVANWTDTVRPSSSYTTKLKLEQLQTWNIKGKPGDFEEDHFISLELGGHPTDPRNLWPEPYKPTPGAHEKDKVENYLHRQVCAGAMTLAAAQHAIVTDWLSIYRSISK